MCSKEPDGLEGRAGETHERFPLRGPVSGVGKCFAVVTAGSSHLVVLAWNN